MIVWLSTALAWTCAEATHVYAHAPLESVGAANIRDGRTYTKADVLCMAGGGVPESLAGQLRVQKGEPFHLEQKGPFHTVVLDLGCGTLRVTGHEERRVVVDGFHSGSPPHLEPQDTTITVRREVAYQECADLSVAAPRDARLLVYHRGRHVAVHGMAGPVEINAPQADIRVIGPSELVEVETLKGDVHLDVSGSVQVDGGQGDVSVGTGPGSTVRLTTVFGSQFVWGGPIRKLDATSVEGDIRSIATLLPEAVVETRSQNGDVLIGVGPAQALGLEEPTGRTPELLHETPAGSLRPDRQLPGGTPTSYAGFEQLPVETRQLWSPKGRQRLLWPSTGAWVQAAQVPDQSTARVTAHSLAGYASAVPLPERVPRAIGAMLPRLDAHLATLGRCRADLAAAVPHGQVDLWARIQFEEGVPKRVVFDTEGFDPSILSCIEKQMMGWTVDDVGSTVVDWPLKLRLPRSGPPPP